MPSLHGLPFQFCQGCTVTVLAEFTSIQFPWRWHAVLTREPDGLWFLCLFRRDGYVDTYRRDTGTMQKLIDALGRLSSARAG